MVTLCFKLSETGTVGVEVPRPLPLDDVIRRYAEENDITVGGYIAVRAGEVITGKTRVRDGDRVEIFPALSGG